VSIAWSDVQAIAPELTDTAVPTATQALLLQIVDLQVDDDAWSDLADVGRRYLAAHLGSQYASGGGAGGYVTSESLGPMSRSYGMPSGVTGALSTTKYGIEYQRLLGLLPCSLGFVP
jgi:hypothetical protein